MADPILKLFGVGKDLVTSQMSQERGTQSLNTTLSDGQLVKDVTIDGATTVPHSLGRTPQGYIVVRRSADESVFDSGVTGQNLSLDSSGAVIVTLWVF